MSQNIWGAIFARERSDRAGEGVGSFFIFRLENVQSGAYLRRKFRLDDMYYIVIPCMQLKISQGEGVGILFAFSQSKTAVSIVCRYFSGSMCERASELRNFLHFHNLKLPFL